MAVPCSVNPCPVAQEMAETLKYQTSFSLILLYKLRFMMYLGSVGLHADITLLGINLSGAT